jgi:hypothetical protein
LESPHPHGDYGEHGEQAECIWAGLEEVRPWRCGEENDELEAVETVETPDLFPAL